MSIFGIFLVRIQADCWKIRTRKTPITDTFYAVKICQSTGQRKPVSWYIMRSVAFPGTFHYEYFGKILQRVNVSNVPKIFVPTHH